MNTSHSIGVTFALAWIGTFLSFGAVTPIPIAITAITLAVLFVASLTLLPGTFPLPRFTKWFLVGIVAIATIQLVPGTNFLFPVASHLRSLHGAAGNWPGTGDLYLTVRQLTQIAAIVLAGLLTYRLMQAGVTRATIVRAAVAILALEAIYGFFQVGFGFRDIPFYGPRPYPDSASGTLVNRNSFGGIMAMALPLGAGLMWARYTSKRGDRKSRLERALFWGALAALFAGAIIVSRSRGAALAALAGVLALPFLLRRRGQALGVVALLGFGVATVFVANTEPLLERFSTLENADLSQNDRVIAWKASIEGWKAQPIFGYGIGSFPSTFRSVQPPTLPLRYMHAHNEYIHALFEGGPAWLLLLVAGLGAWLWRALRGLPTLHGSERVLAGSCIAAVLSVAVHSLVDFDLHITSNAILFGILLAAAVPAPAPDTASRPAARSALPTLYALSAASTLLFVPLNSDTVADRALYLDPVRAEVTLNRALALAPFDARASWVQARAAWRRGDNDLADRRFETAADLWPSNFRVQLEAGLWFWEGSTPAQQAAAAKCLRRAFERNPNTVDAFLQAFWWDRRLDVATAAAIERTEQVVPRIVEDLRRSFAIAGVPPATQHSLLQAIAAAGPPGVESIHRERFRALMPTPRAGARFAAYLVRNSQWRDAVTVFDRLVPVSPENAFAWDQLADSLRDVGQWGLEADVREKRLKIRGDGLAHAHAAQAWLRLEVPGKAVANAQVAAFSDPSDPDVHVLLSQALEANKEGLKAAGALTVAIKLKPEDVLYRLKRAALYEREKMFWPAADDYEAACTMDPENRAAAIGHCRALFAAGKRDAADLVKVNWMRRHPQDLEAKREMEGK